VGRLRPWGVLLRPCRARLVRSRRSAGRDACPRLAGVPGHTGEVSARVVVGRSRMIRGRYKEHARRQGPRVHDPLGSTAADVGWARRSLAARALRAHSNWCRPARPSKRREPRRARAPGLSTCWPTATSRGAGDRTRIGDVQLGKLGDDQRHACKCAQINERVSARRPKAPRSGRPRSIEWLPAWLPPHQSGSCRTGPPPDARSRHPDQHAVAGRNRTGEWRSCRSASGEVIGPYRSVSVGGGYSR
jgi:hypothetical protein